MVTHIDDNGFLRFGNIGGVSPFVALGQRVYFENGTMGVIGSERVDDPKNLKLEKLYIDIGAKDKKDAESKVQVGTSCAFHQTFIDLGDRVVAKAMDDRVACAIIIEVLRRLEKTDNEIYAVFATQEEVGLRGARAAAYGISPDVGIALDVTRTGDTPKGVTMDVALGKGLYQSQGFQPYLPSGSQELHGQDRGGERHPVPDGSVGGGRDRFRCNPDD